MTKKNPTNNTTHAVIYARVSNVKQTTQGSGLASQETRCREFARFRNYEIVKVFADDMSGSMTTRPGMVAMLAFLQAQKNKKHVVIVDDISRLARGLEAHLQLRAAIATAGGVLESPSIEFGEDSDSILVENLLASVSQHQRQKNAEQTKNRMRARAMNGYWVFPAPYGFKFERRSGEGKVLVRNEPLASVVQEALEGFATGRFQTQTEVKRFLERYHFFPKDLPNDEVSVQRVTNILTRVLYAGYLELPNWQVSLREGRHEGLIDFQTFQRIQQRLKQKSQAPYRKNSNKDFPLRGFVTCGECEKPMTSSTSTGAMGTRHFYYMCFSKGCSSYRKSIRRDQIEREFDELLGTLQPTRSLFAVAHEFFKTLWSHRLGVSKQAKQHIKADIAKTEKQITGLLDRIVDASSESVVAAYEKRIDQLEKEKLVLSEQARQVGKPVRGFDECFRTAMMFLSNPQKIWRSGKMEYQRLVLRLGFQQQVPYYRGEGFRTAVPAVPFQLIQRLNANQEGENMSFMKMAHRGRFELPTP